MRKDIIEHNCDFCNKKEIESKETWINPSWIRVMGTASGLWGTEDQAEFCSLKCLASWAIKKEKDKLVALEHEVAKNEGCLICHGLGTVYSGTLQVTCPGCSPIGRKPHKVTVTPKEGGVSGVVMSNDKDIYKYLKGDYVISKYEK
jgi:hypothetical protein